MIISKIHIFELATVDGTEKPTKPAVVCLMKSVIVGRKTKRVSLRNQDWQLRVGVRSGRQQS